MNAGMVATNMPCKLTKEISEAIVKTATMEAEHDGLASLFMHDYAGPAGKEFQKLSDEMQALISGGTRSGNRDKFIEVCKGMSDEGFDLIVTGLCIAMSTAILRGNKIEIGSMIQKQKKAEADKAKDN